MGKEAMVRYLFRRAALRGLLAMMNHSLTSTRVCFAARRLRRASMPHLGEFTIDRCSIISSKALRLRPYGFLRFVATCRIPGRS